MSFGWSEQDFREDGSDKPARPSRSSIPSSPTSRARFSIYSACPAPSTPQVQRQVGEKAAVRRAESEVHALSARARGKGRYTRRPRRSAYACSRIQGVSHVAGSLMPPTTFSPDVVRSVIPPVGPEGAPVLPGPGPIPVPPVPIDRMVVHEGSARSSSRGVDSPAGRLAVVVGHVPWTMLSVRHKGGTGR